MPVDHSFDIVLEMDLNHINSKFFNFGLFHKVKSIKFAEQDLPDALIIHYLQKSHCKIRKELMSCSSD